MHVFKSVLLGTSAAIPLPERMLPGLYVESYTGEKVLFDAGEGTQLQLRRAGLNPNRIDAIFVTHLHGDHIFGLPGLLQYMSLTGRTRSLIIAGPRGLEDFILSSFKATRFTPRYPLYYAEVEGWGRARLGSVIIEWFPVCHTVESYGYKVIHRKRAKLSREKLAEKGILGSPITRRLIEEGAVEVDGRIIRLEEVVEEGPQDYCLVYTGDTAPCGSVVEESRGCDILFHEATFTKEYRYEAWEYGHSTALDAAIAADAAGVGRLVLFHFSTRYKEDYTPLLREALEVFPHTLLGEDLRRYTVP